MTSRTFLCECNSNTYLDCVEQNVFGSHKPWRLVSTPVPEGRPNKAGGETPGSGFRRRLKPRRGDRTSIAPPGLCGDIPHFPGAAAPGFNRSPLRGFADASFVFRGLRPRLYSAAAPRLYLNAAQRLYSVGPPRLRCLKTCVDTNTPWRLEITP